MSARRDVNAPGYVWVISYDDHHSRLFILEVAVLLNERMTVDLKLTSRGCELVNATLAIDPPDITC